MTVRETTSPEPDDTTPTFFKLLSPMFHSLSIILSFWPSLEPMIVKKSLPTVPPATNPIVVASTLYWALRASHECCPAQFPAFQLPLRHKTAINHQSTWHLDMCSFDIIPNTN